MCVCACVSLLIIYRDRVICVWMPLEARRGQQIPLELELEVIVSHPVQPEYRGWGNRENLGSSEEQAVPFLTELWLQSPSPRFSHTALPKLSRCCPSSILSMKIVFSFFFSNLGWLQTQYIAEADGEFFILLPAYFLHAPPLPAPVKIVCSTGCLSRVPGTGRRAL